MNKLFSTCDAYQDDFVLEMFKHKKNGYFLEIGSWHQFYNNNTYRLELNGWKGIRIDSQPFENTRKSNFIVADALKIDYDHLFKKFSALKEIDYASLDIDEGTTELLDILPFNEYKFKIITIEHDSYRLGDGEAIRQREKLNNKGYQLICKNVAGKFGDYFEDWWIYPNAFDDNLVNYIKSEGLMAKNIIKKFLIYRGNF